MVDYNNKKQTDLACQALSDPKAKAELRDSIAPLVKHLIQQHTKTTTTRLDPVKLEQKAWQGFEKALETFDPSKSISIGSYVSWWVSQALLDEPNPSRAY